MAGPVVTEITHPVRANIERYELNPTVDPAHFFQRSSQPSQPSLGRDSLVTSDPTDRMKGTEVDD